MAEQELLADNAANPVPVRAILRMDAGFASRANLAWLIERGCTVPALQLQEYLACFAADFVRLAAHWLTQQQHNVSVIVTHSVQQMVQVVANTSARVWLQGNVWLLKFTEQSLYAGLSAVIRLGQGAFLLPLLLFSFQNSHF